jgi:hypothetical protein
LTVPRLIATGGDLLVRQFFCDERQHVTFSVAALLICSE